ncbi:MAG: hypothetical protein ABJC26_14645 [Gemmatimonadaceae bacterium]
MFTTCIYCSANLEQNEVLEAFPVGRRLAFDAAQGRLWVVCRSCERWNLTPLDERWEAIEQAEKLYRDARLRVSTDNIGMARLREGLELVRIGEPQRPEMAAWRYGDQFGRRRNRQLWTTGAVVGGVGAVVVGGLVVGVGIASFSGILANGGMWDALLHGSPNKVVGKIVAPDNEILVVQRRHARMSVIERSDDATNFVLRLEHTRGMTRLYGPDAMRAAAQLLPTINRFGGSKTDVHEAVSYLEEHGGPVEALATIQRESGVAPQHATFKSSGKKLRVTKKPGALHTLHVVSRLAMEMALHEEQERRAMTGELKELEIVWREAEKIAHISDTMFDTPQLESEIERLKIEGKANDKSGDQ